MILLYNPPSSASRKPVLPMSLLALGALLEGEHEYRIIDGNLERDPQSAAAERFNRRSRLGKRSIIKRQDGVDSFRPTYVHH